MAGHWPEPLLGDKDAVELGFIIFNGRGREASEGEREKKGKEVKYKPLAVPDPANLAFWNNLSATVSKD